MPLYGSTSVVVALDDSSGTLRTLTPYVQTIGGLKLEAIQQMTASFGDAWEEHTPVGMSKVNPFTIGGFYDDTATTGPHVVCRAIDSSPSASTRTLEVTFGGTNGKWTQEVRVISYEVKGKNGALTEYECVVQPTGSGAWS
jgi:hypothetical protein